MFLEKPHYAKIALCYFVAVVTYKYLYLPQNPQKGHTMYLPGLYKQYVITDCTLMFLLKYFDVLNILAKI